MNANLLIYAVCLFASVFAVSGINIEKFVKTNAIWETRILAYLLIMSLTYLSGSLIISVYENILSI